MNKIAYTINTPYGDKYETTINGEVVKYSNGLNKENDPIEWLRTWIITGIREIKAFGNLGELIPLENAIDIKTFTFKNGKPKYVIQDLDHGTIRIHGNSRVHGVNSIYKSL